MRKSGIGNYIHFTTEGYLNWGTKYPIKGQDPPGVGSLSSFIYNK